MGVEWDTQNDEFVFHFCTLVDLVIPLETNKRSVLKVSTTLYNPLGLISPVAPRIKRFFKLLCKEKLEWDENVPLEIETVWREF